MSTEGSAMAVDSLASHLVLIATNRPTSLTKATNTKENSVKDCKAQKATETAMKQAYKTIT